MPHLSLVLLGSLQAKVDGQLITGWKSNKIKALLTYLAIEADRPHPHEALAGLLWPDYPNASALGNLRDALSALRQAIGDRQAEPPFLLITRDTIQFNTASDCSLDLSGLADLTGLEIDQLEQAVAAYRGGFLEGFSCDSAPFEEWVLVKREQMEQQMLVALRRLAEHYEGRGEYERAITHARKQLELEPWDEEAHQQLMRALAFNGERSAALAQYETCRRLLAQELGVEPSYETTALYESIRDGKLEKGTRARGQADKERAPALTNVLVPLTSFVGRQHEIAEIKRWLVPLQVGEGLGGQARLLTLTGSGGIGKTRLAIQVAAELAGRDAPSGTGDPAGRPYKHGVWLIELAPLTKPELVTGAVASVLGVHASSERPVLDALTDYLREKAMLLVLDNCEHQIDACAQLAAHLLHHCPEVQILASSREALGIEGEMAMRVPSLSLPPAGGATYDILEQSGAVCLFVERAAAALPGFELTETNAPAIVQVCRRLDGVALAIELAAARVRLLKVEQIAVRLDDAFRLLTGGSRTALPRQQTLRATIDWSYNLLA